MPYLRSLTLSFCLLASFGWSPATYGQSSSALSSHPGYVDVEQMESWFGTPASIRVDLQGSLLDLIAQSSRSDREFSRMVDGLQAIQVRGFSMKDVDPDDIIRRTESLATELERRGWRRALYVRDGQEVARVFLRPDPDAEDERIAGLTVLAMDPTDETVVINVVGPISPDQLQRLGTDMQIESLQDINAGPEQ